MFSAHLLASFRELCASKSVHVKHPEADVCIHFADRRNLYRITHSSELCNSMLLLSGSRIPYCLSFIPRPCYRCSPYLIVCRSLYVCYASSSMLFSLYSLVSALRSFRSFCSLQRRGAMHFRSDRAVERKSGRAIERRSDRATKQ